MEPVSASGVAAGPIASASAAALRRLARAKRDPGTAAIAGSLVAAAVGTVTGEWDRARRDHAFDAWEMGTALGERMRALGYSDAVTWRSVELARALTAIAPGELVAAGDDERIVITWFERPAVRAASGWNEWHGRRFVTREAWEELLEAVAARDRLLGVAADADVRAAARWHEGRMAAAGFELPGLADEDGPRNGDPSQEDGDPSPNDGEPSAVTG